MNTVRSYIREILLQEAPVGISYYGEKGKDIESPTGSKTGGEGFNPVTEAGKALDSFFGISEIFKSIPGASLITRIVTGTLGRAIAAPTLIGAGAMAGTYGAYKLYQYETGDSADPKDVKSVQNKADKLVSFQNSVRSLLDRRRQEIVLKTRMKETQTSFPESETAETIIPKLFSHYESQAKKICDATDYSTFFTDLDQYTAVHADIDTLITSAVTGASSKEEAKKVYTEWAYAILVVDFVSVTLISAVESDNSQIKIARPLSAQQSTEITNRFNEIEQKINSESDYKKSKEAIMSLGGSTGT